jgi:hypothetical protein
MSISGYWVGDWLPDGTAVSSAAERDEAAEIVAEGLGEVAPRVATAVAEGAGEGLGVAPLHAAMVATTKTANVARRRFRKEPISDAPSCRAACLMYRPDDAGGRSRVITIGGNTAPAGTRRPG